MMNNKYLIKVHSYHYYESVPRNHLIQIPHFASEETMAQGGVNTAQQ